MASLVSVIIPCYNQARFLSEAIESALDRGYPDKEITATNDGSPDNVREVASKFEGKIVYPEQMVPMKIPYGLSVIKRGITNTLRRNAGRS